MSGYMLNKARNGYLYQQEVLNFAKIINDLVGGIAYLVQRTDEVGPAIVGCLEKKQNGY